MARVTPSNVSVAGCQVTVGQQIDVRGVTHEIVSFDFVSFEGTVHEILVPAPIQGECQPCAV